MSLKKTAEDLLQIAESIEKDAAEVTKFVCDKCNHTTTLAKINAARKTAATEVGENVAVSDITVNDKVHCPACEGALSYTASAESKPYYFDEKKAEDDKDEEKPEDDEKDAGKKPSKEEIDEEKKETPEEQIEEEKGMKLHKEPHTASIDYDKLDLYLKS